MRWLVLFTAVAFYSSPAIAQLNYPLTDGSHVRASLRSDNQQPSAKPAVWPVQLEMRVPFEPTAFPSEGRTYLMYELHLTNFGTASVSLSRIEVLDADAAAAQPIATFEVEQLETMLQPLGGKLVSDPKGRLLIADGQSSIAFMSIVFESGSHIPDRLFHRVITTDSVGEGAVIATHHSELHVLGPPVEGANWLAADGPSNDQDNHHRRGVVILDGRAVDSRRYAIDWKQIKKRCVVFRRPEGRALLLLLRERGAGGRRRPCCHGNRWPSRECPRTRRRVPPCRADYARNSCGKHDHPRPWWRPVCVLPASATRKSAREGR
jgi:hypothetical protein